MSNFHRSSIAASTSEEALLKYITSLGLPSTLLPSIYSTYLSCDSRVWLCDNSSRMKVRDSHIGKRGDDGRGRPTIERADDVSRWDELRDCVEFHAKMATRVWIPTKVWLVNDPDSYGGEWKHSQRIPLCSGTPADLSSELDYMKKVLRNCELDQSRCPLRYCIRSLAKGLGQEAESLAARGRHVTLVICTQGRPTTREGETGSRMLWDLQDELMSLSRMPVKIILRLCTDNEEVRDMYNTLDGKLDSMDVLDDWWGEAMEVYLHNPWLTYSVGIHRLRESGLAPDLMDDLDERPLDLDELHEFCKVMFLANNDPILLPHPQRDWKGFCHGISKLNAREKTQWNPIKKKMMPWISLQKLDAMRADGELVYSRPPPNRSRDATVARRHTYTLSQNPAKTHVQNDLMSVIQRWAHKPPNYTEMYSLERLLVTVPYVMGKNPAVEPHPYFQRWKPIDKSAFADEDASEEEWRELLKRACRKAYFFLNPEKYPSSMDQNQTILLKTIRNIIRDQEEATVGV
eukprot:CAMPEP_0183708582 /NCGR_PEP_ID=MMETSP0737-20130205/4849_1 /TAXON_ID=385413 /ORGANISM="Thalassiosira miniscula, Strain CCMP1093" /LENGTH=516 /DNA_ID=CAMNT_0025936477 /DNA_START=157 /DNA_END=1707 /DNA_ORIENTATION=-